MKPWGMVWNDARGAFGWQSWWAEHDSPVGSIGIFADPPGGMFSVLAGVEEDDLVLIRIFESCFAPTPRLVHGQLFKLNACSGKSSNVLIEGRRFKIDEHARASGQRVDLMNGKRCISVDAFESRVSWMGVNDQPQAQLLVKLNGFCDIERGDSDLVQIHDAQFDAEK